MKTSPENIDCDLFVIGGGSGGVRAARRAAGHGARVVLAEASALGGTCVNVGCVPKKLYSYAAHYAEHFRDAAGFGWDVAEPSFDWERLKAGKKKEIDRLNHVYEGLLQASGVQCVHGRAKLLGPQAVEVSTPEGPRTFTARNILLATGGTPWISDIAGCELGVVSDAMFDLPVFPRRLAIIGGGFIACEFASIFNSLGAQVIQFCRGDNILRGFDEDVRRFLAQEMHKRGVDLRTHVRVQGIERLGDKLQITVLGDAVESVDCVLHATGRVPNTHGLALRETGVELAANGAIMVDEHHRTSVPTIYAIGDVTARVQLTPVALGEAMVLADHLFGQGRSTLDYEFVPSAVFSHPNVGTVGYTEALAREKFGAVRVFRSEFKALKHTLSGSSERTLMKLVVDAQTDRVVGLHMVGDEAGEIVQGFSTAIRARLTKADFDATIGIHPTAAEEFVTMREPIAQT